MANIVEQLKDGKRILNETDYSDILIEIDESMRKKIQKQLLDMYLDILEVCEKYEISAFLLGGSALGAVRHKGFIPWDDDFDIGMTRKDYIKFSEIFEKELSEKYVLNAPNYKEMAKYRFPKVLKKDTIFREVLDLKDRENCMLFLDIFILENVPSNVFLRKIKGVSCNIAEFISGQVFLYENRDEKVKVFYCRTGKSNYYFRVIIGFLFSFISAAQWFNLIDKIVQYKDDDSEYCCLPTGRKHYFGEILKRSELLPVTYNEFEGKKVQVLKNEDYYLRNLYGNYMEIPPAEKREKHFIEEIRL